MNKTTVRVLQEIIRDTGFSVAKAARQLGKARTTIYDCLRQLRKENLLADNELSQAYKKLFLTYPYDFSFLTRNNLAILFLLEQEITFQELLKKSKRSRFTVHQLLRSLRRRGFINKHNLLIFPELLALLKIIKKYQQNYLLELPATAVTIDRNEERDLIRATKETRLPLHKTAFSVLAVVSPYNYYTTKKKPTIQDIFSDAALLSRSQKEKFITASFYHKNRKKLTQNEEYKQIVKTPEYKRFKHGI